MKYATRTHLTAVMWLVAVSFPAIAGTPSGAQALLERVLQQVGGATPVSGVFANTADSIGAFRDIVIETETETPAGIDDASGSERIFIVSNNYGPTFFITADQIGTTFLAPPGRTWSRITIGDDGTITITDTDGDLGDTYTFKEPIKGQVLFTIPDNNSFNTDFSEYRIYENGPDRFIATPATADAANYEGAGFDQVSNTEIALSTDIERVTTAINASVTNILQGLAGAPVMAADVATIAVTQARIGNIATTALGSVNTGEIALIGAGLSLTDMLDDAVGGAGRAVQRRVNATIAQVGGNVAAPVIVLNAALNEGAVDGAVLNIISGLDAEIGRSGFTFAPERAIDGALLAGVEAEAIAALAGGIGTTALGAVNTGESFRGWPVRSTAPLPVYLEVLSDPPDPRGGG